MVPIPRVYVAGSCNISREEEGLRLAAGWMGLGLTLVAGLSFVALHVAPLIRLVIFFPALFSAVGFLQATQHFCVNYGLKGVFNLSKDVGLTAPVTDPAAVQKDKLKSWRILGIASLIAAAVAFLLVLAP